MMTLPAFTVGLPLRIDAGGACRIGDSRVTLEVLLSEYAQGMSAEQIAREYPTLRLAEIYAVLAYYLSHRVAIDAWLTERSGVADQLQAEAEARPGHAEWKAQMKARLDAARADRVALSGR